MQKQVSSFQLIPLVLILGIIGLSLQILAGRILTPEFGNSVYTWGSVIGVFMTSLSLGYFIGGKISHFSSKKTIILSSMIISTISILLGLFGTTIAKLLGSLPFPPQYGVIPAVTLLFAPSTILIGMITPIAIEMYSEKKKGKAAGTIFMIDTIGSIIGAFGATFVLIPIFSVSHAFFILGIAGLLVTASCVKQKFFFVPVILIVSIGLFLIPTSSVKGDGIYFTTDTEYQKLEVFDKEGVRFMFLDNHPQSAMFLNDITRDAFAYSEYFDMPFLFTNVSKVLFIGGGGFTGPRDYALQGIDVTVVELDKAVVDAALKYFEVSRDDMEIIVSDGREYLRNSNEKYDVIILDAFRKDKIPFHLATKEFYQLVYDKLDDNGIVYTNIIGFPEGINSDFFTATVKTMQTTFPSTYSFKVIPENPTQIQNIQIIGSKDFTTLTKEELLKLDTIITSVNVARLIPSIYENVPTEDEIILTDDYAPVEELIRIE